MFFKIHFEMADRLWMLIRYFARLMNWIGTMLVIDLFIYLIKLLSIVYESMDCILVKAIESVLYHCKGGKCFK